MANKSGRPIGDNMNIYYIKGINLVILTETEYNTLIKKYGTKIINKALMILDDWLKKSPIGKKYQVGKAITNRIGSTLIKEGAKKGAKTAAKNALGILRLRERELRSYSFPQCALRMTKKIHSLNDVIIFGFDSFCKLL